MHFLVASVAWDSLAIWWFSPVLLVHLVNFEGEAKDDKRLEEACISTKEPTAPGEWNISKLWNLEQQV